MWRSRGGREEKLSLHGATALKRWLQVEISKEIIGNLLCSEFCFYLQLNRFSDIIGKELIGKIAFI